MDIQDGKLNAFGMDISLNEIIGSKIVDQWFAQLTPDDIALIFKTVDAEMFSHNYKDEKFFVTVKEVDAGWGSSRKEETPIWKATKNAFAKKYNEEILSKVDEIIASEEYQKRATEIAKEIVDYATEGYKQDMMDRVRERMVGNVTDASVSYCGVNLTEIIRQIVQEMMPRAY